MLWSFIAVCLSAWLSVDASYRGPTWQRWVFKPLTLLLLLLLAWQAPMFDAISYLVLAGLCASPVSYTHLFRRAISAEKSFSPAVMPSKKTTLALAAFSPSCTERASPSPYCCLS